MVVDTVLEWPASGRLHHMVTQVRHVMVGQVAVVVEIVHSLRLKHRQLIVVMPELLLKVGRGGGRNRPRLRLRHQPLIMVMGASLKVGQVVVVVDLRPRPRISSSLGMAIQRGAVKPPLAISDATMGWGLLLALIDPAVHMYFVGDQWR